MLSNTAPTGNPPTDDPTTFINEWASMFDDAKIPEVLVYTFNLETQTLGSCPICNEEIKDPSFNSILKRNYCSPRCRTDAMYYGASFLEVRESLKNDTASLAQVAELTVAPSSDTDPSYDPELFK